MTGLFLFKTISLKSKVDDDPSVANKHENITLQNKVPVKCVKTRARAQKRYKHTECKNKGWRFCLKSE